MLAVAGLLVGGSFYRRQVVLTLMVTVWALRLGSFLLLRVLVRRKDARFDKMRDSVVRLAGFWTLQVVWVWTTSLPVTLINQEVASTTAIDWMDYVGWAMWAVGFLIESVADSQRYRFNQMAMQDPRGRPFLDTGLWRYSRHPNYFGEILLWTGVGLSAYSGLGRQHLHRALLALLSPLLTALLLILVSGIPLAEQRDDRRNHRLMAYKQYKYRTSILIPMPRRWYAAVPIWAKRWFFFDRYQLAFFTPPVGRSTDSVTGSARHTRSASKRSK